MNFPFSELRGELAFKHAIRVGLLNRVSLIIAVLFSSFWPCHLKARDEVYLTPKQALYRNDPWGWVEKKVIREVDSKASSRRNRIWRAGFITSVATFFASSCQLAFHLILPRNAHVSFASGVAGGIGAYMAYWYTAGVVVQKLKEEAVANYIGVSESEWKSNLALIPEELEETFISLRETFIAEGPEELREIVADLLPDLHQKIQNHYSELKQQYQETSGNQSIYSVASKFFLFTVDFVSLLRFLDFIIQGYRNRPPAYVA